MSFKVMPKAALPTWVERLCADYRVVGPKAVQDQYVFDEVHSAAELDLGYTTTILPPKKVLPPQRST